MIKADFIRRGVHADFYLIPYESKPPLIVCHSVAYSHGDWSFDSKLEALAGMWALPNEFVESRTARIHGFPDVSSSAH